MSKIKIFYTIDGNEEEITNIKKLDTRALYIMEGNLKIFINNKKYFDVDYFNIFEFSYYLDNWLFKIKVHHLKENFIYESIDHSEPILMIKCEDDKWFIESIWEKFKCNNCFASEELVSAFDNYLASFNLKLRELFNIDLQKFNIKNRKMNQIINFDCTQFITFESNTKMKKVERFLVKQGLHIVKKQDIDESKLIYYRDYLLSNVMEIKNDNLVSLFYDWHQSGNLSNDINIYINSIKEFIRYFEINKLRLVFTNYVEMNNYENVIRITMYSVNRIDDVLKELGNLANPFSSAIIDIII